MKTLNVEQFKKAVKHVADMLTNHNEDWTNPNPQSICFGGWNGEVMCPQNRVAFYCAYGIEQLVKIEQAAMDEIEAEENRRANSQYAAHTREAEANNAKTAAELKVGDFILCDEIGLKFDHQNLRKEIASFVSGAMMDAGEIPNSMSDIKDYKHVKESLVKIIRIEDKPAGFFDDTASCLADWKPQANEGGSATDDFDPPQGMAFYQLSREDQQKVIETTYTLAVLVRDPSGKCVMIDPEGFDYPRYLLLRKDWRDMWPQIVADARREEFEAIENARKAEEEQRRADREAWQALINGFSYLPVKNPGTTGEVSKNLKAALKHEFPGVKFSVRSNTFSGGDSVHVSYVDGPAYDRVKKIVDYFEGTFGRVYGSFSYVWLDREISPELRAKIDALVKVRCPDSNGFDDEARSRETRELIARTDFPADGKIEDIAWHDGEDYSCELVVKFAA